jgi:hypothetical protein
MKAVIYCPRNWNEPLQQWSARRDLCRKISRLLGFRDAVEAEDFAEVQRLCLREGYQRVIVPGMMHIPPEAVLWLKTQRVRMHDAISLASHFAQTG